VLIESPLFSDADDFLDATAELRARGFGTLIGHPERCADLMLTRGAVARERAAGALLQVNASSLTGRHGPDARTWGIDLLRSGAADLIASDAHRATRPPLLSAALDVLAGAGMPRHALEPLVADVPRALVACGIEPLRRAA
jgi:protein-tyrosine phosphatase